MNMFAGLTLDIISKFPPVITFIMGTFTGAFIYFINQFLNVITTNPLDKRFKDKPNQFKLKFWFYATGILYMVAVYQIYGVIFFQSLHKYHSFLFWNNIVWFFSFIYCFFFIARIKFKKVKREKWHYILLTSSYLSSILFFLFTYIKYLEKKDFLDYILLGGVVALLLSGVYFFMLHKYIVATTPQIDYDIETITEEDFKNIKNLKYGYSMDDKRMVFFKMGEFGKEVKYVCDFSSKVFLRCVEITKKP